MIGEYIRPLPLPGDKPESLSVKPTFLSRSGGPRCRFESDVSPALWRQLARCTVKQAVDVGSPPSYSFFRVSLLFLLFLPSSLCSHLPIFHDLVLRCEGPACTDRGALLLWGRMTTNRSTPKSQVTVSVMNQKDEAEGIPPQNSQGPFMRKGTQGSHLDCRGAGR